MKKLKALEGEMGLMPDESEEEDEEENEQQFMMEEMVFVFPVVTLATLSGLAMLPER